MNDFSKDKITRGVRNNNPFNIVRSKSRWLGKIPHDLSDDKVFEQFETMDYGLRAGVLLLRNYCRNKDLQPPTARKFIYRYAPKQENDTVAYLLFLSYNDVDLDKVIIYPSYEFCHLLVKMLYYESNLSYKEEYIYTIINRFKLY